MVQCTPFAVYIADIHIGFEQACSTKRQTSSWFCRNLVWRDSAFNVLSLWSMKEARCQQTAVVWLTSVCGTERRRNWLWRRNSTFASIRAFWYTGTMQGSIVCSLSSLRTWCPQFCSMFGSMFALLPNANVLNVRLDACPSCCVGCWQITAMTMCCFITARVCSVKSAQCLINWYFSILPCCFYLWFVPYLFLGYFLSLHPTCYECSGQGKKASGVLSVFRQ